jgi:hypothetical protein
MPVPDPVLQRALCYRICALGASELDAARCYLLATMDGAVEVILE